MCKKLSIILLFTLLLSQTLSAQFFLERRADKQYQRESFAKAIELYEKAWEKGDSTARISLRLADSHRQIRRMKPAVQWYTRWLEKSDSLSAEAAEELLHYAQVLSSNRQYQEARKQLDHYQALTGQSLPPDLLQTQARIRELMADSSRFRITKVGFNGTYADFGPAFYGNELVFSSARGEVRSTLGLKKDYARNNEPFLNLYQVEWSPQELDGTPRLFANQLTTQYHEGPVVFSTDTTVIFFTRNNYLKLGTRKGRTNNLKIYEARRKGNGWGKAESLPFNSDDFSTGHPALSADGQRLYFASDRPGGFGGTDLYVTYRQGDDWSEPKNLGRTINTEANEMFPFLHPDGYLYFASNRYNGLGGLDIYRASMQNSEFQDPENMGYPMNSSKDDFGLIIDPSVRYGFLASNREDEANDEIYFVEIAPKPPIARVDTLTIFDYEKDVPIFPIANDIRQDDDSLRLASHRLTSVHDATVRVAGNVVKYTPPQGFVGVDTIPYKVCDTLSPQGCDQSEIRVTVSDAYFGVEGKVVYKGTEKPVPGVVITLFNEARTEQYKQGQTDEKGEFSFALEANKDYAIRYVKDSLINLTEFITTKGMKPGVLKVKQLVEMEKLEVGKKFAVKIYFDLAKWDIRKDAAEILDKEVLTFMEDNPTVTIELSAHTDSRGNDAYNKRLSQQRANSAVEYLIGKGINSQRLKAAGYGEERLVNECGNGVSCTEQQHQDNRRVEIEILSF